MLLRTVGNYVLMPNYRNYWKEAGYEDEMNAVEAALKAGRNDEVPKYLTDRWLADITLFGPAAKIREGVEAWPRRRHHPARARCCCRPMEIRGRR